MLTRTQIAQEAQREGVPLHTVERDYVQHLVLRQLPPVFIFRGGTCLRIAYGSPRYSEDLDFNADIPKVKVSELFQVTARRLLDYGIRAEVVAKDQARLGYLGKLRYEGPLFDGSPMSRGSIRLEVSLRGEAVSLEERFVPRTPYPDVPQLVLQTLTSGHLFAEKTRALIIRKKPRDLYDVHFLLARGVESSLELINRKMAIYRRRIEANSVDEAIETAGKTWNQGLAPLLGQVPPYALVAEEVSAFYHRMLSGKSVES